jgi:hypothetical protein
MKILEIKSENNKNAKIINIVNVDLNVDFDNKFPEEKKENEKQQEVKAANISGIELPVDKPTFSVPLFKPFEVSEDLMVPNNLNQKSEPIGNKLDNNPTPTLSQEEVRKRRLAYFQNKFAEQQKLKK